MCNGKTNSYTVLLRSALFIHSFNGSYCTMSDPQIITRCFVFLVDQDIFFYLKSIDSVGILLQDIEYLYLRNSFHRRHKLVGKSVYMRRNLFSKFRTSRCLSLFEKTLSSRCT
jgi:hypothetical protein